MSSNKTIAFSASLGVNKGYGHENEQSSAGDIVAQEWQKAAAAVHGQSGVYVSAVVADSKTVYHTDWGCPVGGESTALITGECNPEYTSLEDYKNAVIETLKQVAKALGQSTTQVRFAEVDFCYLDFRS